MGGAVAQLQRPAVDVGRGGVGVGAGKGLRAGAVELYGAPAADDAAVSLADGVAEDQGGVVDDVSDQGAVESPSPNCSVPALTVVGPL